MSYTIDDKMTHESYKQMIQDVFNHLRQTVPEEERIYMDSEFDSSQTLFEEQSNRAEIGVVASNDTVGFTLLLFLRMCIDDNLILAKEVFHDWVDVGYGRYRPMYLERSKDLDIESVVKALAKRAACESKIHPRNQVIERRLEGYNRTTTIRVDTSTVDLWTLDRVEKLLMKKLSS